MFGVRIVIVKGRKRLLFICSVVAILKDELA